MMMMMMTMTTVMMNMGVVVVSRKMVSGLSEISFTHLEKFKHWGHSRSELGVTLDFAVARVSMLASWNVLVVCHSHILAKDSTLARVPHVNHVS
eukprot:330211-Amphidinium_carterae.1